MKKDKSRIQSCVDHINTAVDVDPWAKEMAEELLASDDPVGTLDGWLEFWGVKKC